MKATLSILFVVVTLAQVEGLSRAQQPKRIPRIGWVAFNGSESPRDFMVGLRERGYIDGQSVIIEYRSAQSSDERLSEIAAELVRLKPDVIVASGNRATDAAKKATATIPIVFSHGDPVWDGIAGSLARPGKNLTGLSNLSFELAGKRLELLRDAFPKVSRIAVLLNPDAAVHRRQFADMEKVAQSSDVQLQALDLRDLMVDFNSVYQRAINQRSNAFVVLLNSRNRVRLLVDFVAKNRLPAIYPSRDYADAGGLMSYGVDFAEVYRRIAYYVDRILKGAKPADLPVEQPTKFELVINLRTAREIGVSFPPKVLMWADRVIKESAGIKPAWSSG